MQACVQHSSRTADFNDLYIFSAVGPTARLHLGICILMCTLLIYDIYITGNVQLFPRLKGLPIPRRSSPGPVCDYVSRCVLSSTR